MKKEFKLISEDYNLGFAKLHYRGWIGFFFFCVLFGLISPFVMSGTVYLGVVLHLFAVVLLLKNGVWERNGKTWQCVYRGSWNWLLFLTLLLWPIALTLFILSNPSWVGEDKLLSESQKKKSKNLIIKKFDFLK
jgi:hypothetical protein